jgi:hypothetical protein
MINSTSSAYTPLVKVVHGADGWIKQPISTALEIELTNNSTNKVFVDGYAVEYSRDGSPWTRLPRIEALEPRNIEYDTQPKATHFDISTAAFDILAQQPLNANQPIRAWMFFGGPNWINPQDQKTQFRLTLFDSRTSNARISLKQEEDPDVFIKGVAPRAP